MGEALYLTINYWVSVCIFNYTFSPQKKSPEKAQHNIPKQWLEMLKLFSPTDILCIYYNQCQLIHQHDQHPRLDQGHRWFQSVESTPLVWGFANARQIEHVFRLMAL